MGNGVQTDMSGAVVWVQRCTQLQKRLSMPPCPQPLRAQSPRTPEDMGNRGSGQLSVARKGCQVAGAVVQVMRTPNGRPRGPAASPRPLGSGAGGRASSCRRPWFPAAAPSPILASTSDSVSSTTPNRRWPCPSHTWRKLRATPRPPKGKWPAGAPPRGSARRRQSTLPLGG